MYSKRYLTALVIVCMLSAIIIIGCPTPDFSNGEKGISRSKIPGSEYWPFAKGNTWTFAETDASPFSFNLDLSDLGLPLGPPPAEYEPEYEGEWEQSAQKLLSKFSPVSKADEPTLTMTIKDKLTVNGHTVWQIDLSPSEEEEEMDQKTITKQATEGEGEISKYALSIQITPFGAGIIMLNPSNIIYDAGTVVNLDISPKPGWIFDHWEGDVEDPNSASTTITMNAHESITAVFVQENEVEGEAEGQYEPEGEAEGQYELEGEAEGQYEPEGEGEGETEGEDDSGPYGLYVSITPPNGGAVITTPESWVYDEGEIVSLEASANSGWIFDHWEGDVQNPNSASTTITMNSDESITAVFVMEYEDEGEPEGELEGEREWEPEGEVEGEGEPEGEAGVGGGDGGGGPSTISTYWVQINGKWYITISEEFVNKLPDTTGFISWSRISRLLASGYGAIFSGVFSWYTQEMESIMEDMPGLMPEEDEYYLKALSDNLASKQDSDEIEEMLSLVSSIGGFLTSYEYDDNLIRALGRVTGSLLTGLVDLTETIETLSEDDDEMEAFEDFAYALITFVSVKTQAYLAIDITDEEYSGEDEGDELTPENIEALAEDIVQFLEEYSQETTSESVSAICDTLLTVAEEFIILGQEIDAFRLDDIDSGLVNSIGHLVDGLADHLKTDHADDELATELAEMCEVLADAVLTTGTAFKKIDNTEIKIVEGALDIDFLPIEREITDQYILDMMSSPYSQNNDGTWSYSLSDFGIKDQDECIAWKVDISKYTGPTKEMPLKSGKKYMTMAIFAKEVGPLFLGELALQSATIDGKEAGQ